MIELFRMAYRNIGRNRVRSFLSALALGIGVALLIFMAAVISGEMRDSMENTIRLQTGHLQIRSQSYDEEKTSLKWNDLIEDPAALTAKIAAEPGVQTATPRLYAVGIANKGEDSLGVRIFGVDPASEANQPFRGGMVSGDFLAAGDRNGIVVGKALADKLNVRTGDDLYMMVNTSTGDVAEQSFTIRGIYDTHTPTYDESTVVMPLDKAQGITGAGNHASAIFILLNNRDQADTLAATMPSGYQVKTWRQMNAMLTDFEQLANGYMYLLYLIILGVAVTVIVNTLVMAVFERTREIGILAAIGMKGRRIMTLFFAESSLLTLGGIVIGLVLGWLTCTMVEMGGGIHIPDIGATGITFGNVIHTNLTLKDAVTLSILAFIVSLLAALYPARLAANMEPVEALRGGK